MTSRLTETARYASAQEPVDLLAALRSAVEPQVGGFQFVSKLSGGGVVVRVLRAPQTERGWFGTVDDDRFSIVMVARDSSGTPFQPILRGEVAPTPKGSTVDVELAAHPDARAYSVFFVVGGVLLGGASTLALSQGLLVGWIGLALAGLFLWFPALRARLGFEAACETSRTAFAEQFGLAQVERSERRAVGA